MSGSDAAVGIGQSLSFAASPPSAPRCRACKKVAMGSVHSPPAVAAALEGEAVAEQGAAHPSRLSTPGIVTTRASVAEVGPGRVNRSRSLPGGHLASKAPQTKSMGRRSVSVSLMREPSESSGGGTPARALGGGGAGSCWVKGRSIEIMAITTAQTSYHHKHLLFCNLKRARTNKG